MMKRLREEEKWFVPAGLDHWLKEALKAAEHVSAHLNKYPSPKGVANNLVPRIRNNLAELRAVNRRIEQVLPGWMDRGNS